MLDLFTLFVIAAKWLPNLRSAAGWAKGIFPETVDGATILLRCVTEGRSIRNKVAAPNQFIEVRYEDLCANPVPQLSKLFDWLSLDADVSFTDRCAASYDFTTVQATRSFDSIPARTRPSLVGRKRGYNFPRASSGPPTEGTCWRT